MLHTHHPLHSSSNPILLDTPKRQLFASVDLDETRALVSHVMKPHELGVLGNSQRLDARMYHAGLGDVTISRLRYGASVRIEPGQLEDFFLIQMPLTGCAQIDCGAQHVDSTPEVASVLSPQEDTRMHWAADCDQVLIRIARPLAERTLAAQLGHELEEPLVFQADFRWRESTVWRALICYLCECVTLEAGFEQHKLIVHQMEQLVTGTLLTTHRHNYSDAAPARVTTVLPRHVRRVQEYLRAHAHETIAADQLARIAGVSLRSLYAGFKDFTGTSPMQYLKDIRLDRAREELLAGHTSNVAGVALRWGFAHMGRFSVEYKARFGESPSQSLRRH